MICVMSDIEMEHNKAFCDAITVAHKQKSKYNNLKTLHLVLKSKWFDKIASGEKTSEYRSWKKYWNKKFTGSETVLVPHRPFRAVYEIPMVPFDIIVFHKGYTNEKMVFQHNGLFLVKGYKNDLGEDIVYEIKLGKRLA